MTILFGNYMCLRGNLRKKVFMKITQFETKNCENRCV